MQNPCGIERTCFPSQGFLNHTSEISASKPSILRSVRDSGRLEGGWVTRARRRIWKVERRERGKKSHRWKRIVHLGWYTQRVNPAPFDFCLQFKGQSCQNCSGYLCEPPLVGMGREGVKTTQNSAYTVREGGMRWAGSSPGLAPERSPFTG